MSPKPRRSARRSFRTPATAALIAAGALISAAPAAADTMTFATAGAATSWTIPNHIGLIHVQVVGAKGGNNYGSTPVGGAGADAQADLDLTTGSVIQVYVGGDGGNAAPSPSGGFNGGAAPGITAGVSPAGGGGGASDIRTVVGDLATRLITAGGGGGANGYGAGGAAGQDGGAAICPNPAFFPQGRLGTSSVGGAGGQDCPGDSGVAGSAGTFGAGGIGGYRVGGGVSGGGGGGGWYGGGGGGGYGGGGGGSSRFDASAQSTALTTASQTPRIVFTYTPLPAPTASTEAASAVSVSAATLNATVNPGGGATTYRFEYGTSTSYGSQVPASDASAGSGTSNQAVSQSLSGLAPNTTYHYRVVATNAAGTTNGSDQVFTTSALAPVSATLAATEVGRTTAMLNGTVDPSGVATTYRFEYGSSTDYGSSTAAESAGSGNSAQPVSAPLSGLTPDTTYHVRLVSTNAAGTSTGGDETFTTPPPAPEAGQSGNAQAIAGTVLVKLPGTDRFVPLSDVRSLPVGTIFDATAGTVSLTVSDGKGGTSTGEFSGGVFVFGQETRRVLLDGKLVPTLITDLGLSGGDFEACPEGDTRAIPATIARRRTVRYLAAKAHGNFNVVGKNASGLERGTQWRTTDTCTTTEVRVGEGEVLVTDYIRRRTVAVKAGTTYVARPRAYVIMPSPARLTIGERLVLPFTVPDAGVLEVIAHHHVRPAVRARAAGILRPAAGRFVLARGKMQVPAGGGTVTARLELSERGRRMLRRNGRSLRVVLTSRYTPTEGAVLESTRTVVLRETRTARGWDLSVTEAPER